MNTWRNVAWRLEEEIFNAVAHLRGEQVTPLEEDAYVDKALTNPPPLTNGDVMSSLIQLAHVSTVQAQAMTTIANRELVPCPNQHVTTMTSYLRDFTWMNPPTFYRSKVDKYPQELIDEVYKILLAMGLSTS